MIVIVYLSDRPVAQLFCKFIKSKLLLGIILSNISGSWRSNEPLRARVCDDKEEREARNVSKTHGPHNSVLRVGSKNDDIIT